MPDDVTIRLKGDNRDLAQKLGPDMKKNLNQAATNVNKFSDQVKKIMQGVIAMFAIAKIKQFADECVELYKIQELAEKKLQQTLITTGEAAGFTLEQLKALASQYQTMTVIGDEEWLEAFGKLATFTKITGDEFKRANMLAADLATRFGTDLQSAALQLGKALQDPVKGVAALSRSGVSFTDKQKAVLKALVDTNQLAEAQRLIMDELATQVGGEAAAAAETFAGKIQQAKNRMGDLKEEIGKELQPAVEALTQTMELLGKVGMATVGGLANSFEQLGKNIGWALVKADELAGSSIFDNLFYQKPVGRPHPEMTFEEWREQTRRERDERNMKRAEQQAASDKARAEALETTKNRERLVERSRETQEEFSHRSRAMEEAARQDRVRAARAREGIMGSLRIQLPQDALEASKDAMKVNVENFAELVDEQVRRSTTFVGLTEMWRKIQLGALNPEEGGPGVRPHLVPAPEDVGQMPDHPVAKRIAEAREQRDRLRAAARGDWTPGIRFRGDDVVGPDTMRIRPPRWADFGTPIDKKDDAVVGGVKEIVEENKRTNAEKKRNDGFFLTLMERVVTLAERAGELR